MFYNNRKNQMNGTTSCNGRNTSNSVGESNGETTAAAHKKSTLCELIFNCQLAHGKSIVKISEFKNIQEMYLIIARSFQISDTDILFCTLNTNEIDMTKLLGGQIGLDEYIYVHTKGQAKEVEIIKNNESLGLTITDNGNGNAFIKKIKDNSTIFQYPHIFVGDHIEKINNVNMVGKTHFEVAKHLKDVPLNSSFTMRLIEPVRRNYEKVSSRNIYQNGKQKSKLMSMNGKNGTIRFKAKNVVCVDEMIDNKTEMAIEAINLYMENYFGVSDMDLAMRIWELSENRKNSIEFMESINKSDLVEFEFCDEFIFELWGIITDARAGRLKKYKFGG